MKHKQVIQAMQVMQLCKPYKSLKECIKGDLIVLKVGLEDSKWAKVNLRNV